MKKIFTLFLAIFLMASALCIRAFAAEAPSAVVLCISALKKDGLPETLQTHTNFEDGWNAAMKLATSSEIKKKYERLVVDLCADWNALDGEFTDDTSNGPGFDWDAIYFQENIRMTLNLNGYTINRGLTEREYNGEVMCVDEDADLIINNGTITGGWSRNGAGGIHIKKGAKVTLNHVNVIGNRVDNDNGAGIALYKGATLTMNGGCVSQNLSYNTVHGGGVYVEDASAIFTDVKFQDNQGLYYSTLGAAVAVNDGTLEMKGCTVSGNGLIQASNGEARQAAYSILNLTNGSKVTLKESVFSENGYEQETTIRHNTAKYTTVIHSTASYLTMETCSFKANHSVHLIQSEASILNAADSDFTENRSFAFYGNCARGFNSAFTNCKFSYTEPMLSLKDTFYFNLSDAGLSFVDCRFEKASFNNKNAVKFVDSSTPNSPASIFGEGSLAMVLAILALLASVVSICLTVSSNRRKAVPIPASPTAETKTST